MLNNTGALISIL